MVNANDIRSAIGDYLAGAYSFDTFENWMIANTRNIHKWGDPESKYLAYSVDLQVAEYLISDKITEKNLKSELQYLANTYLAPKSIIIVSGTSTSSVRPLGLQSPPAGKLSVGAYELLGSH